MVVSVTEVIEPVVFDADSEIEKCWLFTDNLVPVLWAVDGAPLPVEEVETSDCAG